MVEIKTKAAVVCGDFTFYLQKYGCIVSNLIYIIIFVSISRYYILNLGITRPKYT